MSNEGCGLKGLDSKSPEYFETCIVHKYEKIIDFSNQIDELIICIFFLQNTAVSTEYTEN